MTRRRHVTATELATLAKCQRQGVLDALHGKAPSASTAEARAAGEREHARHHFEALRYGRAPAGSGDRRCYVATALYGPDAPETQRLRAWRDRVLVPHAMGRMLVRLYYRLSPPLLRLARTRPCIGTLLRDLTDRVLRWIG